MSGVKRSHARLLALGGAMFALAGCASGDLARFAPPGIVKYEELAGDQPVNPEVAARVEARRQEDGAGEFPKFAETPGRQDRPEKTDSEEIKTEIADLTAARDALDAGVDADLAAASEDLGEDLSARRDNLKETIDKDSAAAARERREKLKAPPVEETPADKK